VARLVTDFGIQTVPLDDFFLPLAEWPSDISPSFPFPFYRYAAFLSAVEELAVRGSCEYLPFDWNDMRTSEKPRTVHLADGAVAVDGTSSLHPKITPLYDIRFFIESDDAIIESILERDGTFFEKEWRTLWLPSVEVYMQTNPRIRADFLVAGRGVVTDPDAA